jgi:2-dehydropantoate 2-reductase
MHIAVMAAGAVGGYFGARLAAAGHRVSFIARGSHLEAIRVNGLQVKSPLGNLHLPHPEATDDPARIGPVDIVLFAVKLWDTERAARQALPLIGPNTRVITFQNGVDSVERIAPILGAEQIIPGSAYIATVISSPGIIAHTGNFARLLCGRADGAADEPLRIFVDSAKATGLDITLSSDMERELWQKFVFLVGLSGATATTRMPLGPILADPDTRKFLCNLMREVVLVARAKGISVPEDYGDDRMKFAASSSQTFKSSLLHDLERGNRLEIDWLAGKVVQLGRSLGIATPANEAVYAMLKLHRMGKDQADNC